MSLFITYAVNTQQAIFAKYRRAFIVRLSLQCDVDIALQSETRIVTVLDALDVKVSEEGL